MAGMTLAGVGDMIAGKVQELKGKMTGQRTEVLKGKACQVRGYGEYKAKRALDR
jgi:uncharacterized protein YjbJ (UPF0337 family)